VDMHNKVAAIYVMAEAFKKAFTAWFYVKWFVAFTRTIWWLCKAIRYYY